MLWAPRKSTHKETRGSRELLLDRVGATQGIVEGPSDGRVDTGNLWPYGRVIRALCCLMTTPNTVLRECTPPKTFHIARVPFLCISAPMIAFPRINFVSFVPYVVRVFLFSSIYHCEEI